MICFWFRYHDSSLPYLWRKVVNVYKRFRTELNYFRKIRKVAYVKGNSVFQHLLFVISQFLTNQMSNTGRSLSEALIFASTNPQYDDRLFIELQVQYMKIPSSNLRRTCCVQKLFLTFRTIFVLNMFSPCSAKRRASDKDLPVPTYVIKIQILFQVTTPWKTSTNSSDKTWWRHWNRGVQKWTFNSTNQCSW